MWYWFLVILPSFSCQKHWMGYKRKSLSIRVWLVLVKMPEKQDGADIERLSLVVTPLRPFSPPHWAQLAPSLSAQKEEAKTCKELLFHLGLFGCLDWAKPISSNDTHGGDNWQQAYGERLSLSRLMNNTSAQPLFAGPKYHNFPPLGCYKQIDTVRKTRY